MNSLLGFVLAFSISLGLVPLVLSIAHRNGWFDQPNERKIHTEAIPRLGGVGIFYAFILALLVSLLGPWSAASGGAEPYWLVILCAFALHLMGLLDDFSNIRALSKFLVQTLAALILIGFGYRFRVILLPFGDGVWELGWLSYPLTFLWIVGVTNAINLIDGMDGLAGGISAIAALNFGIFFLVRGNPVSASIALCLVGAIAGFLVYNRPPARIFMGDSGSLFLGFTLAVLPLLGPVEGRIEVGFLSAITILLIPIYDTLTAIIRRKLARKPFFSADKRHLHHKLLSLGLSTWTVLGVVYGIAFLLGGAALTSLWLSPGLSFACKIGTWLALLAFFVFLHFRTKSKG